MSGRSHASHVVDQFGAQATAYVTSAVHAGGADLDRIGAVIGALPGARALDLGCGGGHVAFAAAAAGAAVTAYDLSAEMLAAVSRRSSPAWARPDRDPPGGGRDAALRGCELRRGAHPVQRPSLA